jgi:uncharacterized protein YjbI with pentapeptide repeats
MPPMMPRLLAALFLAAATLSQPAYAGNPKDVARAKDTSGLAECVRCDLSGADLRNGFFQFANLIEADLSRVKADGANMAGVQFHGAKLNNGTFTYVNFSGAQFQGADMRGADFSNAWFNWAWFAGAKLDGADFTGAKMIGAQLQGADLSKAKGLTTSQLRNACADALTKLPPGVGQPWCPF